MLNGEKSIVIIKGSALRKPGFWTCELAIFGRHLSSFSEFELAEKNSSSGTSFRPSRTSSAEARKFPGLLLSRDSDGLRIQDQRAK